MHLESHEFSDFSFQAVIPWKMYFLRECSPFNSVIYVNRIVFSFNFLLFIEYSFKLSVAVVLAFYFPLCCTDNSQLVFWCLSWLHFPVPSIFHVRSCETIQHAWKLPWKSLQFCFSRAKGEEFCSYGLKAESALGEREVTKSWLNKGVYGWKADNR